MQWVDLWRYIVKGRIPSHFTNYELSFRGFILYVVRIIISSHKKYWHWNAEVFENTALSLILDTPWFICLHSEVIEPFVEKWTWLRVIERTWRGINTLKKTNSWGRIFLAWSLLIYTSVVLTAVLLGLTEKREVNLGYYKQQYKELILKRKWIHADNFPCLILCTFYTAVLIGGLAGLTVRKEVDQGY